MDEVVSLCENVWLARRCERLPHAGALPLVYSQLKVLLSAGSPSRAAMRAEIIACE
jgi:hypothetical protein